MKHARCTPGECREGTAGWVMLTAYVVAWDVRAAVRGHETLSAACWRGVCNPRTRGATVAAVVYLAAHLLHVIPDRVDPLRRLDLCLPTS